MRSFPLRISPSMLNRMQYVLVGLLLASPLALFGQYTLEQKSEPGGLFSTSSQNYNSGTTVQTRSISTQYDDFIFTHWTINNVRQNNGNGQALHTVNFSINENSVAIAHYLNKEKDTDADGIPDWIEIKYTGNLSVTAQTDADGDGIPLGDEVRLGLNPSIDDNISQGGISIRRSGRVLVNFGGAKKLTLKSHPIGLVTSAVSLLENNVTFQTDSLNGLSNGYYFSHWEVNGVRYSDNKGVGLPQVSQAMNEDKLVVAQYIHENQDSDNDQIPDWYESHYLGTLEQNQSSDSDGDSFSLAEELKLGLSSVIDDNISEGGISVRRSAKVFVNLGGASKVTIQSTPPGLVSSSLTYPEINSTYTTPSLSGLQNGYYFSHWEVNGVRQADPTGLGLSQVTKKLTEDKSFIAKYYPEDEDLDQDGIPDWFEWHEQGNLDLNGTSDPDGDGFTLAEENKLGLSSLIFDQISEGSISTRRSKTHSYVRDLNDPTDSDGDGLTDSEEIQRGTNTKKVDTDGDGFSDPDELSDGTDPLLASSFRNVAPTRLLSQTTLIIAENQPVDTHVGNILGFDPNDPQGTGQYHFIFVDGNGSRDNQLFNLASDGSLSSATIFDYEALVQEFGDANLTIRVRVSDSANLFFEDSLPVTVINVIEDFDQDGIEDSIDSDDDNDGFTDALEKELGTDPLNPASIPNQAPTSLSLSSLKFPENLPPYSVIGAFNASDPDKGATFNYHLVTGKGSKDNPLFRIDSNGSLLTGTPFDFETNATKYSIRVQVSDEWNASLDQNFTLQLIDIDEIPPTLTLLGEANITIIAGSPFQDPGASWTDDRDGNGTVYSSPSDFDITQAGTYQLHYQTRDQAGNPAKEVQRTLIVKDPTLPLVHTLPAQLEQNQSLLLQAELITSGGLHLAEIGMELGTRPSLSDGTLYPFKHASDSNGTFSSYVENFPIGEALYYRSYAINSLGITHGATRKISLPHNQDPTTWWSGATIHEGGWRTLDWFGSFLLTAEDRWVYHADLGWVYLLSDQQGGLWLWKEGLDWVWTSQAASPFYWMDSSSDWIYPLHLKASLQIFWDYSTEKAIRLF